MGQIGSYIRRKEDSPKQSENNDSRRRIVRPRENNLSSFGIHELLSSRIPDAFLVHETKSSKYVDEDGDVANEFYLEENEGSHRILRKTTRNIRPQRAERYLIPRLHPDVPIVIIQIEK
ncbi:hypothetical protein PMAYCL1PPCAC_18213 [Pristionchus mayeri]|uniref:Uncharacterized protein n=1 Tax=Pristionchus mayeri TaxID=1317129 RepID=A0AAN5CP26_9BILA|nr:hypothetical protein PMAYCL1PPCAC_18213 [Pristionchus mayeri]